jgi:hypothetical protein
MRTLACFLVLATLATAEIVDRLAVSVATEIITEQQILLHLRTAAFLNGEKPDLSAKSKRQAAQKLIELALIGIEMRTNKYPPPAKEQVDRLEAAIARERFSGNREAYLAALSKSNVPEAELRDSLRWQLAVLSFIDFRFRPGVQITEEEIRDFYDFDFKESFVKSRPGQRLPDYGQARRGILEAITQQRIDNLLDRWLNQTESSTRVKWVETVFQESAK